MINRKNIAAALIAVSALFAFSSAQAEGPMNEDLSPILTSVQSALAAGQTNDKAGFAENTEAALKMAKDRNAVQTSPRLERVIGYLKSALNKSNSGDQAAANQSLTDAVDDLK